MKFLSKKADSLILAGNLVYLQNRSVHNKEIQRLLLLEQNNFCAYTEKYVQGLDATEVEHFNSVIKYADGYYNYYAVLRKANEYKIKHDNVYKGATFFNTLFFQNSEELHRRVQYVDGVYEEANIADTEAKDLIDFLGFNEHPLYEDRKRHVNRLKGIFRDAKWDSDRQLVYFRDHPEELSFITALEQELNLDLSAFYQ